MTRKKNKKYKKYYGIRAQGFKDNYYNWDNFLYEFVFVVFLVFKKSLRDIWWRVFWLNRFVKFVLAL